MRKLYAMTVSVMFDFLTRSDAVIAERFIKKRKSRKVIEKIVREGYRLKDQIVVNIARAYDPDRGAATNVCWEKNIYSTSFPSSLPSCN